MRAFTTGSIAVCIVCLFVGCPNNPRGASGDAGSSGGHPQGTGGTGVAGSSGASGSSGSNGGTGGKPAGGSAGAAGSTACPGNVAIPALCKMCAGGSCGTPTCSGGKFVGFVCPSDTDAGTAGTGGSSGGGVCNLACIKGKHCVAKPTPTCVDDAADAGAGVDAGTALHWVAGCGTPVCQGGAGVFDDPNTPNCTSTQKEGEPCTTDGERCDGVLTCGATLLCAAQPPRTCPISRARYKQDISYLGEAERAQFHDQITQLRLASYRYKTAPDVPQLGFMIDDVEPSVAVSGDHVNLYAYLSMAVAAIQVQDEQIKALQRQLEQVQAGLETTSVPACMSEPSAAEYSTSR